MTLLEQVGFHPPVPERLDDLGLSAEFVTELLLRTLYVQGARSGQQLADALRVPYAIMDNLLLFLQQRRWAEVLGMSGLPARGSSIFDLTAEGRGRARDAMAAARYIGPVPVPLAQYRASVEAQSAERAPIDPQRVRDSFQWLVLEEATLNLLGPAIKSARSILLYGEPGNGKTAIAETMAGVLGGSLLIPSAIEIHGQILGLFDPVYHVPVSLGQGNGTTPERFWLGTGEDYDRRYVRVARPVVQTGGELTLDQLDLQFDPHTKLYQAPFQMIANGGVLIIDDLGRQRVSPRELLNRWIVPLEKRLDYLMLHTGSKFPVPFDCQLIFVTNLPPAEVLDEAFLRRIHYKVGVGSPTPEQYRLIFRGCCEESGMAYQAPAVDQIYRDYYARYRITPRGCHPRDLLGHLRDIARYLNFPPVLSPGLVDQACHSYFLNLPAALEPGASNGGGTE